VLMMGAQLYSDKAAGAQTGKEQVIYMIHPSYVDLMQVVNKGVEEGETPVINSRYSIVMATAKRARQNVDGDEPLIDADEGDVPLSIAVEELNQEKIRILAENDPADDEVSEEIEEISEEEASEMQDEFEEAPVEDAQEEMTEDISD